MNIVLTEIEARVLGALLESAGEIVFREQLRARIWGDTTFVEFDQGLNYCIRQIRRALRDGASEPLYVETLPKQGYRFIARVAVAPVPEPDGVNQTSAEATADPPQPAPPDPVFISPAPPARKVAPSHLALGLLAVLAIGGAAVYSSPPRTHPLRMPSIRRLRQGHQATESYSVHQYQYCTHLES